MNAPNSNKHNLKRTMTDGLPLDLLLMKAKYLETQEKFEDLIKNIDLKKAGAAKKVEGSIPR